MTKTAVYIATTDAPVRIELISQEDIPRSQVVPSNGFVPLPGISEQYEHFVSGIGPVARAFGPFDPPMFSMELSAEIEDGTSWHLAAFIAHGLAAKGRLAGPDDAVEAVIWATGVMGADFSVTAEHVALKFERSRGLFEATIAAGQTLDLLVPAGSIEEALAPDGATTHHLVNGMDVLPKFGLRREKAEPTEPAPEEQTSEASWRKWPWTKLIAAGASALILAIVAEVIAEWFWKHDWKDLRCEMMQCEPEPVPPSPKLATLSMAIVKIEEIRASPDEPCAAVHFGNASGHLAPVRLKDGVGVESRIGGLCGIRISLGKDPRVPIERVSVETMSGRFVGHPSAEFDLTPVSRGSWRLFSPRALKEPIAYSIRVKTHNGPDVSITHKIVP